MEESVKGETHLVIPIQVHGDQCGDCKWITSTSEPSVYQCSLFNKWIGGGDFTMLRCYECFMYGGVE